MIKPNNYDESAVYTGEFNDLPNGAYNCIIKNAIDTVSYKGERMLEIWVDISEGEHRGYFQNLYESQKQYTDSPKWRGIIRQLIDGKSTPYFKGLISNIQKSNPGYVFDFAEEKLFGKKIGGVFRHKQYAAQDGTLKFAVECWYLCDISQVKDILIPEDKLLTTAMQPNVYDDHIRPDPQMEEITGKPFPF